MKTPQQGAATSIYLASSPKVEGVTGTYFANGRPQTSNKASYDEAAAARLWQVSAGLVGSTGAVRRTDGPNPTEEGPRESNQNDDPSPTFPRPPAKS